MEFLLLFCNVSGVLLSPLCQRIPCIPGKPLFTGLISLTVISYSRLCSDIFVVNLKGFVVFMNEFLVKYQYCVGFSVKRLNVIISKTMEQLNARLLFIVNSPVKINGQHGLLGF